MATENKKFLDLDGLDYYNGKVQTKLDAEKTARTAADTNLQTQINGLASGSPMAAASTAEMTDTTRVYVNTTDGHWYYWNGSAWTDGGVYQGTEAANDSIHYGALTQMTANDSYKILSTEDLVWVDGITYYFGSANDSLDVTNAMFRASAGTVIEISDIFRVRLAYWGIDGHYIGDTGSYVVRTSTTIAQDCFVAIGIASNPQSTTFVDHSTITNDTIKIKALRDNKCGFAQDAMKFSRSGSSDAISNSLYVGKGTVVRLVGDNILNSSSAPSNTPYRAAIDLIDSNDFTSIQQGTFTNRLKYVVPYDSFIRIRAGARSGRILSDSDIANINNSIEIDYVEPSSLGFAGLDQNFKVSNDVSQLGLKHSGYAMTNNPSQTGVFVAPSGSRITISSDFISNYNVEILSMINQAARVIHAFDADNLSYTFANDTVCAIRWNPIDNDWETANYSVDYDHALDSSDITEVTFRCSMNNSYDIPGMDTTAIESMMQQRQMEVNNATGRIRYYNNNTRAGWLTYMVAPIPLRARLVDSSYQYGIVTADISGEYPTRASDTGWTTNDVDIPANTPFILSIKKPDNSSLVNVTDFRNIVSISGYADMNYVEDAINRTSTLNYTGIDLDLKNKHGYNSPVNYLAKDPNGGNNQGFAIYGNYLVQLYADAHIAILDTTTGDVVGRINNVGTEHGDTCQFSETFYDADDMFPLLYVSTDRSPQVAVVRISNPTTASVIKKFSLTDNVGYYSGQCFDFQNGLLYNFGYKANSYRDPTNNATIVSVYNMNNQTLLNDNVYGLELVDQYEIPFVYCVQGQKFLNGFCYLVSSYLPSESATTIRVYDPVRKLFVASFPGFPSQLTGEMEDIEFVLDDTQTKYDLILSMSGSSPYYKIVFL